MLAEAQIDALLGELYAGVLEPERLDGFLVALGRASGSHLASMTREDFHDPVRSSAYTVGVSPDELARYARHAGDNIWIQRSLPQLRAGTVHNSDDWVGLDELRRSRYYNEFLRDIDTLHSLALCGEIGPAGGTMITLCRSGRTGPYEGPELALLQRVAQHWANASVLRSRLQAAQAPSLSTAPLATGVFMLDKRCRLREGNAAAERMLALGWWRKRADGSLEPGSSASRATWKRVQREAAAGPGAGAPVFAVHEAGGRRAAYAALHPFGAPCGAADATRYLLFVRPIKPMRVPDAARLRTLFGLTAAEAALAVALHHTGDLSAAAAALSIGERGARTRLQSLFDKTDCRRQGELLRTLDAIAELCG